MCQKTLETTTQLVRHKEQVSVRDHYKARDPQLNVRRLNETFAVDTLFASSKALGGYTCVQLFAGKESMLIECFPMLKESHLVESLQDFIRKWGHHTLCCLTMPSPR